MATRRLRHAKQTSVRRTQSGQGLVEFALVGSLFFFLIFSIVNAGFFLYGRNAVQHAADVGVATIAAEGNYANPADPAPNNADTVGISRMDTAGLTTTPLISVTEIDVYHELQQANGTLVDDTSCSGACVNRYSVRGNVIGTVKWPPGRRDVGSTPDFARLVIQYKYSMLVNNATFTLSTDNTFRLEPQG